MTSLYHPEDRVASESEKKEEGKRTFDGMSHENQKTKERKNKADGPRVALCARVLFVVDVDWP